MNACLANITVVEFFRGISSIREQILISPLVLLLLWKCPLHAIPIRLPHFFVWNVMISRKCLFFKMFFYNKHSSQQVGLNCFLLYFVKGITVSVDILRRYFAANIIALLRSSSYCVLVIQTLIFVKKYKEDAYSNRKATFKKNCCSKISTFFGVLFWNNNATIYVKEKWTISKTQKHNYIECYLLILQFNQSHSYRGVQAIGRECWLNLHFWKCR